jgi:hypothetical protein
VKEGGGGEGDRERERALELLLRSLMTIPFTGLFIAANCNSRFSHGRYTLSYGTVSSIGLLGQNCKPYMVPIVCFYTLPSFTQQWHLALDDRPCDHRVPERTRTRSDACMSDTYIRISPTRILLDVNLSIETWATLWLAEATKARPRPTRDSATRHPCLQAAFFLPCASRPPDV